MSRAIKYNPFILFSLYNEKLHRVTVSFHHVVNHLSSLGMNCSRFFITVVFLLWTSILCFAQDTINRPSICLSLGFETVSMHHQFSGTVNDRYKTPVGASLKTSFYVRSVKGRSFKLDMGFLQYSSAYGIKEYPGFKLYGGRTEDLRAELEYLRFLNSHILIGNRFNMVIASKAKRLVIPFDVYAGLNFQVPINRENYVFFAPTRDGAIIEGDSVYRESRTIRGKLPRLSLQLEKEFKLSGNVNWYMGFNWVQGFAPFLQKKWWIEFQGREHDFLSVKHTGSYFGFEIGMRGML